MSTMVQTDRSPFTQMRDGLSDVFSPGPFGAVGFGSVVRSGSSIFDADTIFERSLGGAGAGAGAQWITASTTDVLTPNGDELSDSASVNSEGESTECGTPDGDQHIWGVEATGSFATSSAPLRAPLLLPLDVNCKLEPLSDPATATTTAAKKRGKKRLAEEGSNETSVGSCKASRGSSSSGSSSASNSNSDVDDERQVEKLVGLLSNAVFQPGGWRHVQGAPQAPARARQAGRGLPDHPDGQVVQHRRHQVRVGPLGRGDRIRAAQALRQDRQAGRAAGPPLPGVQATAALRE
jgi:hypothetical protein